MKKIAKNTPQVTAASIPAFVPSAAAPAAGPIAIYIASPLGFSEATRYWYNHTLLPAIARMGYGILDPWQITPARILARAIKAPYGTERRRLWREANAVIGHNNAQAIRKSHIVVAVLDGTDVDSGTAAEIGYASALGKPVVGYRGDVRLTGDNDGSVVNLQVEYWIRANGGNIYTSLEDLLPALNGWYARLRARQPAMSAGCLPRP